jgi:RluA family pseudouridine synthase
MSNPPTLYEDRDIVVVDKPCGIGVVAGRNDDDALAAQLSLLVCHRLDVGTSGVLVLARTALGQRKISEAFASGAVEKTYLALCQGKLPDEGLVDVPLGDWKRGRVQIGRGRNAVTRFQVERRNGPRLRVYAFPQTGRTHQVRAHLAWSGAPIVGDEDYGGPPGARVFLHALRIVLPWPNTGARLDLTAPEPPGFDT